jgi:UDP-N-acetylenolpyruvoylglucosamine reductase
MVELERDAPLKRLTTVRTGGSAELFARVRSLEELRWLLAYAESEGLGPLQPIGSGSNLLVADVGVPGIVIQLAGQLARVVVLADGLECGGGARLPSIAARAAAQGLSGIEFAVNIPGTVGGAVRMNANAYEGVLADALEWVEVATARSVERRSPQELGFAYRSSALSAGEIVSAARFILSPAPPDAVRDTIARMRRRRHTAQPKGIKTFGSTFKNPAGATAGQLLAAAGAAGLRVGAARLSPKHANFVENLGEATTADVVALMTAARELVLECHGVALEREVQVLGPVVFPWEAG